MNIFKRASLTILATAFTVLPLVASAASVSIQNLNPAGAAVFAKNSISFNIVTSGFNGPVLHLSDSFPNTTASINFVDGGGKFIWTPVTYDVGTHVLTISVTDNDGNSGNVSQTITVLPPPSIAVQNILPSSTIMPGTTLTFSVTSLGFTNPTFIVGDTFSGPSITNNNLDASGNFSWKPDASQNGDHTITIYASDALGHNSSVNVPIRVGAGPTISIGQVSPSANVNPGQTVSFAVSSMNFSPTAFSAIDSFPSSSVSNGNIGVSGMFSWIPSASDVGAHIITITGQVGAFGASASTTQTINVLGPGGVLPTVTPAATASTSTANLALTALQAQLAFLQAKMAAQGGGSAPAAVSDFRFSMYLKPGSNGDEVLQLQKLLAQQGFLSVEPNGNYGPATVDAVAKFQGAHGLDQLGVVGPATRAALNSILAGDSSTQAPVTSSTSSNGYIFEHFMGVGDDDPDVTELQNRLISLGFMSGEATGYYGSKTEAAVKKYQTDKGLPATGYVAKDTRAALNK